MIMRLFIRVWVMLIISSSGALAQSEVGVEYYNHNIKPIFASRCVQCHSCYNAPCQLNLGSIEGLDRGLVTKLDVFDPGKIFQAQPSRLGIDRKTTEGWRDFSFKHKFMPVTQNTGNIRQNIENSFILTLVQHKKANSSLIVDDLTNPKEMAENSRVCPDVPKKLADHLMSRPNAGMPYGLPPLSDDQILKIKTWTEMGSPREFITEPLTSQDAPLVKQVENYLNKFLTNNNLAQAKKESLVSRYIYEHLFLAHIYLRDEKAPASFYTLIRSRNSCDHFDEIATRRPWYDTSVSFFYCLKRIDATIVSKTHMPFLVDQNKLARWENLFYSKPWQVSFVNKVRE